MSMQDPISDMLTRVRNGVMSQQKDVSMPSSKMKEAIAEVLKDEGYITDYKVVGDGEESLTIQMEITHAGIIYDLSGVEALLRVFMGRKDIRAFRDGMGMRFLDSEGNFEGR